MKIIAKPSQNLQGETHVPGDKSLSHRALILSAIANGKSEITNFLFAKDCLNTLQVLTELGVEIKNENQIITVEGRGLHGLTEPQKALDFGNAGTGIRLMCGLLAGQAFNSELLGDEHLNNRPMNRIIKPLSLMGASITGRMQDNECYPPLNIQGGAKLKAIEYALPIASAQVKSALLLAGLYANGQTVIKETKIARDHTERMLSYLGADIQINDHEICLSPANLTAKPIQIPNDISSAAFFMVGAALSEGSHIQLKNIGVNPTRCGILKVLQAMGADIQISPVSNQMEPTADIEIKGQRLNGIECPKEWVVEAIDEFPIIFIAASCAKGRSIFKGLEELKVKESNRISAMAHGLKAIGVECEVLEDGIIIEGQKTLKGGLVQSFSDHRIAMAFAMASLKSQEEIVIENCENIETSFPSFCTLANKLGLNLQEVRRAA